jgi:hypothetical protein
LGKCGYRIFDVAAVYDFRSDVIDAEDAEYKQRRQYDERTVALQFEDFDI